MAVNGVEIEISQKWRCGDGEMRTIVASQSWCEWCWQLSCGSWVTDDGCYFVDGTKHWCDLKSLVN